MKPKASNAFTLVELLVVIGIIAVLISILLPSLAKARAAAVNVACQSNLRQLGIYALQYTIDSGGWLPVTGSATKNDAYAYSEMSPGPWAERLGIPNPSNVWPNYCIAPILRCPSLYPQLQPNPVEKSGAWEAKATYALNMYLGGWKAGWASAGQPSNGYPYKSLRVRQLNSEKYWFCDSSYAVYSNGWRCGGYINMQDGTMLPFSWMSSNAVPPHPGNSANFLMGDGHVENLSKKEWSSWPSGYTSKGQWKFTGQRFWTAPTPYVEP